MAADGSFTGIVGCRLPIQLASLGGPIGTPELASAVSDAGGLGMIPNPSSAVEVERVLATARGSTSWPLGWASGAVRGSGGCGRGGRERADVVEIF